MKGIEVELKFPLHNPIELIEQLGKILTLTREVQKDTYFTPPNRNFLTVTPISEWLRLRETSRGYSINYKKWHNETGATVSCDEFQTSVESATQLRTILERLGFEAIVVVEKTRLSCVFDLVKVAIDEVKGLGHFIELEATEHFPNPEVAEKHLWYVLKELGAVVGEQDFEGYPYRLLKQNGLI